VGILKIQMFVKKKKKKKKKKKSLQEIMILKKVWLDQNGHINQRGCSL
jgi:hypothetical protein